MMIRICVQDNCDLFFLSYWFKCLPPPHHQHQSWLNFCAVGPWWWTAGGEVCFVTLKTNWPKKSFVAFSDFHNSIEFQINSIDAPPVRYNPQGQGLQAPYTPQVPLTPAPAPAARAHILWEYKKEICKGPLEKLCGSSKGSKEFTRSAFLPLQKSPLWICTVFKFSLISQNKHHFANGTFCQLSDLVIGKIQRLLILHIFTRSWEF